MRFMDPPTLDSPWRERPGDDVDGLLTAFFRSELPRPWPAAPEPTEALAVVRPVRPPRRACWTSRLALAASVALLLAGGLALSGKFQELPDHTGGPSITEGTATTEDGRPVRLKITPHMKGVQVYVEELDLPDTDDPTDKRIKDDVDLPPE